MASKVRANMRTCHKTALVTAELLEDGQTLKIHIASDCDNVRDYAKRLGGTISAMDCVDYTMSKVFADENRQLLSMPCMVPCAIMNAAWMELSMLSKSLAKDVGSNDNEFIIDDE